MNTTTKNVRAEIRGQELVYYIRSVVLEVPEDMTGEEVESIDADYLNEFEDRPAWEITDSDGLRIEGVPEVLGDVADNEKPDVIVYRDEAGEFRVRPNEKVV
jgi:hypothetical protein